MSGNVQQSTANQWTNEQYDAIVSDGSNILVAAAAGSGKTAVLVERIIRKIISGIDVDSLLVATFTNAAAAEMRDRIKVALEKQLEIQPDSEHLKKQIALMGKASITTLHSFCLDVIRKYYPLIGLDPGFRIANETEVELIRIDILNEIFEEKYSDVLNSGIFLQLVNAYGGERGDDPLFQLVEQLYIFSRSHPWPTNWLEEAAAVFHVKTVDELEQTLWVQQLSEEVWLKLSTAMLYFEQAMELTKLPAGPHAYASTFENDISIVENVSQQLKQLPWREWNRVFSNIQFDKLAAMRGKDHDKDLQERAKALREKGKNTVLSIADEYFGRDAEQFLEEMQQLYPLMVELVSIIIQFAERFDAAKREKGLLDFGDLEHYCLKILLDPKSTSQHLIPSAAAHEYQQQFHEILLDEYQDTNMVQETIVQLISRTDRGNRFMVGDVKQSIYRFRLAEPKLFLQKYKVYGQTMDDSTTTDPSDGSNLQIAGKRIDLAKNFRSRIEVVDAVNFVFRAIMKEKVAEMDYDQSAELVYGASYYPESPAPHYNDVHFTLIDKSKSVDGAPFELEDSSEESMNEDAAAEHDELSTAQLEARYVAKQLLSMRENETVVYDKGTKGYRPFQWRDVVILLRATSAWAPVFIEELQKAGIPSYANIASGYFEAIEVETMLSLLQVIDNPYQDIPLAAVLRSPLFGLTASELADIRILSRDNAFYDAVLFAAGSLEYDEAARHKLSHFLTALEKWRDQAREGSLSNLLWSILQETGYYDFVGGLPGGVQRQANLRALHDRSRQYEATSFRGLFRFLRFIDKMKSNQRDLGTAQAIGEQEDVVRIMTTHASKGLEFPIVFVAGLGKNFNTRDLNSTFLKHKELGFGPKFVNTELRVNYPSLPYFAIKRAMKMELLAEEMRILYVALTRPKEKLFLVGTIADAEKKIQEWQTALQVDGTLNLASIASASNYLAWFGPLVSKELEVLATEQAEQKEQDFHHYQLSERSWKVSLLKEHLLINMDSSEEDTNEEEERRKLERLQGILALAELDEVEQDKKVRERLERSYPYEQSTQLAAKSSITEMKRMLDWNMDDNERESFPNKNFTPERSNQSDSVSYSLSLTRPSFMEKKKMSPVEKGSINHLMMQHVPLDGEMTEQLLQEMIDDMIHRKLLSEEQAKAIHTDAILYFFNSELGQRMRRAKWVKRELPFSFLRPAQSVYPDIGSATADEPVLIQGVIDCLFEDEKGIVLIDYKTDRIYQQNWKERAEKHRYQLDAYSDAISSILKEIVNERYIFFFDGAVSVKL